MCGGVDSATAERVLALDVLVGQPHELLITEQVECATDDEFVDRVGIAAKFDVSIAFVLRPVAVLDGIVDGQQIAIDVTGEPQLAGDGLESWAMTPTMPSISARAEGEWSR